MDNSYLDGYQDGTEGLGQGQIIEPEVEQTAPVVSEEAIEQEEGPNLFQQAQDFVAENFLGRDQEESQALREEGMAANQKAQDVINADASIGAEVVRAGVGGVAQAAESIAEFGDLAGDTLKTFTGIAGEEDNVFSDKYEQADYDLGVAENLTGIGKFGREAVSFLVLMRGAKAVPGLGTVGTQGGRVARVGGEALRGAVADLISDSGEGNLSNALENAAPGLKDTWVTALAHDDDDNPWIERLKNVVEGGILGVAVDGLGELVGARLAARRALKEGKSMDEAVDIALDTVKGADTNPRPNAQFREMEGKANGANDAKPSTFNPEERAFKETTYEPEDVIKSQAQADDFSGVLPVSAKPLLTDYAVGIITKNEENLSRVIAQTGSKIDVDKLSQELGQTNAETTAKALVAVREFLGMADETPEQAMKAFDDISFVDADGLTVGSREAVVATKTLIRDTSLQISDIATAAMDLAEGGADVVTRQVPMLTDRLSALLRLHKTSAGHYASGLQSFKIGPITIGGNKTALSTTLKEIDDKLTNLKELAREGDPESLAEFKRLANALVLAGGDPTKQMDFMGTWLKHGSRELLTAMYNSMLSSPLSQVRNVFGSVSTTVLRPVSLGLGYTMQGNFTAAKASMGAFHSFGESISEAFQVFGTSMKTGVPVNEGQKFITYTKQAAEELQLLKASASSDLEKNAVGFLENTHNFMASPWFAWPTRTLSAVDDGFKTLVARMELKRGVFMESLDDSANGIKFNPERYAELAESKFGKNGEILDKHLLATAKEATFQQDLQGAMKAVSSLQQQNGVVQFFVPFLRTPHNIMVYAGTHTPFVGAFFSEFRTAMKSGDPEQQAVMLGRQAIGSMAAMHAVNMALNDNITGAGPVDSEKRKIWLKSHQPYSVKIGGRWVSYQSLEPVNQIFAAAADLTQLANAGATGAYDKSVAQLAFTIAAATYDKSYYTGLADMVSFFNPEELAKGKIFSKTALDGLNRLIPLSGARRQLAKALSPGIYEWRGELDKQLASAIPGYAQFNSVPKIDIFTGEQMLGTSGNIFNNLLPFSVTAKKDDPVINRLGELGIDVQTETSDRLKGMKLSPEEKFRINQLMSEQGIYENLKSMFGKDWFNKDVARWQKEKESNPSQVVDARDSLWYEKTYAVFADARSRAIDLYMRENNDFRDRVNANQGARRRAGRGQYDVINDLVKF